MEVRARTAYAQIVDEWLHKKDVARASLRQVFDKFDTLCSQPNFFTPLRLTGLTCAMVSVFNRMGLSTAPEFRLERSTIIPDIPYHCFERILSWDLESVLYPACLLCCHFGR